MSWSFEATAKDKDKLKAHSRKQLLSYHDTGTRGHAMMTAVADKIDAILDLFQVHAGQMIKINSSGHLDRGLEGGASGNFKLELTNYCGTFLD